MAVSGALLELTHARNWEHFGAVTPEAAAELMLTMLMDFWQSDDCADESTPEEGLAVEYPPSSAIITYAPQDPFVASEIVPDGYALSPFYRITAEQIPAPGAQLGDVFTDVTRLPLAFPPLLPPSGYPRFRIHFNVGASGAGVVEIHLIRVFQGGLALVTTDNDPASADFVDMSTGSFFDLTAINALLGTALDGDLIATSIIERQVSGAGAHFIDVTFLPKITTASLIGYGGGLRKIVLSGEDIGGIMPAPEFRLNGDALEWRPNDGHVWVDLGDVVGSDGSDGQGITAVDVTTLAAGAAATVDYDAETGELALGIPRGDTGDTGGQGLPGTPGLDGECPDCDPTTTGSRCNIAFGVVDLWYDHMGTFFAAWEANAATHDLLDPDTYLPTINAYPLAWLDVDDVRDLMIEIESAGTTYGSNFAAAINAFQLAVDAATTRPEAQCALYCAMPEDYVNTPILAAFFDALEALPGTYALHLDRVADFGRLTNALEFGGLVNVARSFNNGYDCAECGDCEPDDGLWCYEFDFTVSNAGWSLIPGQTGTYTSGLGWQRVYSGQGGYVEIRILIASTTITHFEQGFHLINDQYTREASGAWLEVVANGNVINLTGYQRPNASNNEQVISYTPDVEGVTELRVRWQIFLPGTTDFWVNRVLVRGTGENPFGEDNC